MTVQFNNPYTTIFDANGKPVSGATAEFYISGTGTPADVFSDAELQTPIAASDLKSNAAGRLPRIFMASGIYRVLLKYPDGTTINSYDDYDSGLSSALGNGASAQAVLNHEETSGTTSPVAWSIRVGGVFTFNGSSGTNTLGGTVKSYLRIRELGAF